MTNLERYLNESPPKDATNTIWDSLSREVNLLGAGLGGVPEAASDAVFKNPGKSTVELLLALSFSTALAYASKRTGGLATTVRLAGSTLGAMALADLGKNSIPLAMAMGDSWQSGLHQAENEAVMRKHMSPLCIDLGIGLTGAIGGEALGRRLGSLKSIKSGTLVQRIDANAITGSSLEVLGPEVATAKTGKTSLTEGTAAGRKSAPAHAEPADSAVTPHEQTHSTRSSGSEPVEYPPFGSPPAEPATLAAPNRPAGAAAREVAGSPVEINRTAPIEQPHPLGNAPERVKLAFDRGLNDLSSGNFDSNESIALLDKLRRNFGMPPTAETNAIMNALGQCKIGWNEFGKVIDAVQALPFGWPCVEALPIVKELNIRNPGLHSHISAASKYRPETLEPIRQIYNQASAEDQRSIVAYLEAQYHLQVRGRAPTMLAHCDKYPCYSQLVEEFAGIKLKI